MRERLQTLSLSELKETAKSHGIKDISSLKKTKIIDLLCAEVEKNPEVKPAEIRKEEEAETPRNQEASRSQEAFRGQEAYHPQDQSHAPECNRSRGQDYQENRNDSKGTDNRRPISRGCDNKYTQNRTQPPRPHGNSGMNNNMSQDDMPSQSEGKRFTGADNRSDSIDLFSQDMTELDSGIEVNGTLEAMLNEFELIRYENFLPGESDIYAAPSQIRRFNLKTGDIVVGSRRAKFITEKFAALLYIKTVNGCLLSTTETRPNFEDLTPVFSSRHLHMETPGERSIVAMCVLDLLAPIGKRQHDMTVSPPKAGKIILLRQVVKTVTTNNLDMYLMIPLIDECPKGVTDIKEAIMGPNVEVIYPTFDEPPDRHKRVSEMMIERAKYLVEHGRDVIILLDSTTRLAGAYNLTVVPSGRTLSGGLDPAVLHIPRRFFGMARNMREGGSLTILAATLVETGNHMDDIVYEEFKGTGSIGLVFDKKLSERHIFPVIDILKSGVRRDDLPLSREGVGTVDTVRETTNFPRPEGAAERALDLFARTRNSREFVGSTKWIWFS